MTSEEIERLLTELQKLDAAAAPCEATAQGILGTIETKQIVPKVSTGEYVMMHRGNLRQIIAALQRCQAEQSAAGFEAWDRRYEQERLDCGPTAKALQMTVEKPQAAWQTATQAAEARHAEDSSRLAMLRDGVRMLDERLNAAEADREQATARVAEFRRRVTEAIREQPLHMDAVGALVHAMDLFNQIFAAERPGIAHAVIHQCPPEGSGIMPCCGQTPFGVSGTDRITTDARRVTCNRAAERPGE